MSAKPEVVVSAKKPAPAAAASPAASASPDKKIEVETNGNAFNIFMNGTKTTGNKIFCGNLPYSSQEDFINALHGFQKSFSSITKVEFIWNAQKKTFQSKETLLEFTSRELPPPTTSVEAAAHHRRASSGLPVQGNPAQKPSPNHSPQGSPQLKAQHLGVALDTERATVKRDATPPSSSTTKA